MRFMFDIKEIVINRCANIYSRRNTGRPVENRSICLNSVEFPKKVTLLIYSKAESTVQLVIHFVSFHYNMILIYCGVLSLRRV